MKVAISYPPIINKLGQKAMVSQNRNVQFFSVPTYLLPVIHAQAATRLKKKVKLIWDDGNAKLKSYEQWFEDITNEKPDIIVLECTTPVIKFLWKTINDLKDKLPKCLIILTGYHSMRKPNESFENSKVDIIILSNHVDFVLNELIDEILSGKNFDDLNTNGIAFRKKDGSISSNYTFKKIEKISQSEIIDRDLVQWKNYAYENGNFLQTPGTYATSVIRDCTFGKCTFCRYNGPELSFSIMDVKKSVDEYENLIKNYNVKEIFDDSGVWYRGQDARNFAKEIIKRGLHKKNCYFGFNTRFEYLDEEK